MTYEFTNLQYYFYSVQKLLKITVYTRTICLQNMISENITVSFKSEQMQYLFLCFIYLLECELYSLNA